MCLLVCLSFICVVLYNTNTLLRGRKGGSITEEQNNLSCLLSSIIEQLKLLNAKLDLIVKSNPKLLQIFETPNKPPLNPHTDVLTLLKLSKKLQQTALALYKCERATADDIAKVTGRLRAVESASANQLVSMGYVKKKREGRTVYFSIEPELEDEK